MLRIGEKAPQFQSTDQNGNPFDFGSYLGKQPIVLYFYPKNETSVCTAEACSFRDAYEDFTDAGAVVIGVSADSVNSHKRFAENRRLPFILLSDSLKKVHNLFGLKGKLFGLFSDRVTFVIDQHGVIRAVETSSFDAHKHVQMALRMIRELA